MEVRWHGLAAVDAPACTMCVCLSCVLHSLLLSASAAWPGVARDGFCLPPPPLLPRPQSPSFGGFSFSKPAAPEAAKPAEPAAAKKSEPSSSSGSSSSLFSSDMFNTPIKVGSEVQQLQWRVWAGRWP
jgi:hypothetical protein